MKKSILIIFALSLLGSGAWSCGGGNTVNNPAPAENNAGENSNNVPEAEEDDAPIVQPDEVSNNSDRPPRLPNPNEPALDLNGNPIAEANGIARFAPPRIEKFRILNSIQQTQRNTQNVQASVFQDGRLEGAQAEVGFYYYPAGRDLETSPLLDFSFSPAGEDFRGNIQIEGPVAFRFSNQQVWTYDFQRWTPAWNDHAPRRNLINISRENLHAAGESTFPICPAPITPLANSDRYYIHQTHPFTFNNSLDYAEFAPLLTPENQCPIFRLEEAWNALSQHYSQIRFLYVLRVLSENGNTLEQREAELVVNFDCGKWEYSAREEAGNFWNIRTRWANNYRCQEPQ